LIKDSQELEENPLLEEAAQDENAEENRKINRTLQTGKSMIR
jgi:hypothetical protein